MYCINEKIRTMKKLIVLTLVAAMMVACDKSELDEACMILKEQDKAKSEEKKTEPVQDPNFRIFNDKLKGAKGGEQ